MLGGRVREQGLLGDLETDAAMHNNTASSAMKAWHWCRGGAGRATAGGTSIRIGGRAQHKQRNRSQQRWLEPMRRGVSDGGKATNHGAGAGPAGGQRRERCGARAGAGPLLSSPLQLWLACALTSLEKPPCFASRRLRNRPCALDPLPPAPVPPGLSSRFLPSHITSPVAFCSASRAFPSPHRRPLVRRRQSYRRESASPVAPPQPSPSR